MVKVTDSEIDIISVGIWCYFGLRCLLLHTILDSMTFENRRTWVGRRYPLQLCVLYCWIQIHPSFGSIAWSPSPICIRRAKLCQHFVACKLQHYYKSFHKSLFCFPRPLRSANHNLSIFYLSLMYWLYVARNLNKVRDIYNCLLLFIDVLHTF